jgi:hypothetical protein
MVELYLRPDGDVNDREMVLEVLGGRLAGNVSPIGSRKAVILMIFTVLDRAQRLPQTV